MEIYEKNLQYIKENYGYIKLDESSMDLSCEEFICKQDDHGISVVGKKIGNHDWWLGSSHDSESAAKMWVEQFGEVDFRAVFIVLGFGNGEYIKTLRQQYPKHSILVCEPDLPMMNEILKVVNLEDILSKNTFFLTGDTFDIQFMQMVESMVSYDNMREVRILWIPNYNRVNEQLCLVYKQKYKNRLERLILARNTCIIDEDTRAANLLKNFFHYIDGYSIAQLSTMIEPYEPKDRTAIIVAAGPSLDKNVHLLKRAKGKSFIIAVDTALRTLIKHGIEPDLAIMIDPEKAVELFENEIIQKLPMVVSMFGNNDIIKKHKGQLFFATGETDVLVHLLKEFHKDYCVMYSGGSVSNNAYSVVGGMGFKTFIFVGLDLAYPNGTIHTKDAYDDENGLDLNDEKYFQVEDVNGDMVYTEANMDCYRRWFEDQAFIAKEVKMIDATEGGAKIKGMEIMSLEQALEKYSDGLSVIDFQLEIEQLPKLYNDEEKIQLREWYCDVENKLDSLKKEFQELIDIYISIEEEKVTDVEEAIKNTSPLNKSIEGNSLVEWTKLYGNIVDYQVLDELNKEESFENLSEEQQLARGGRIICETYRDNIDKVKEIWHSLLVEYKYI